MIFPEFLEKIERFEKVSRDEHFFSVYDFTFCPKCEDVKRVEYYNTRLSDKDRGYDRMRFPDCGHDFLQSEESRPVAQFSKKAQRKWYKTMEPKFQLEILKNEIKNKLMVETAAFTVKKEELEKLLLRVTKLGSKNKKAKKEK